MLNGFTFKNQPQYIHQSLSRQSGQRCKHLRFRETGVGSHTKTNSTPINEKTIKKLIHKSIFDFITSIGENILYILTLQ